MQQTRFIDFCAELLFICFVLISLAALDASAQQPKETPGSRGSTSDAYSSSKPAIRVKAARVVGNRHPGKAIQDRYYQTNGAFPDKSLPIGKTFVTVGVTIARGRLATNDELNRDDVAKVKGCVQWDGKKCVSRKEMVLARIEDSSAVSDKDQIQMTIEYLAYLNSSGLRRSNSVGYLYVINREQYADGTYGKPKLIFPTLNTYDGDNHVMPGRIRAMPEPERLWTVWRSDSGKVQAFETYTIIASPEPLKDLAGQEIQPATNPVVLDEKLVTTWVRLWGGSKLRGDLENGADQLITQREVRSSRTPSATARSTEDDLSQDDQPPQMVFGKVVSPGSKLLITIKLPFKEQTAPVASKLQ